MRRKKCIINLQNLGFSYPKWFHELPHGKAILSVVRRSLSWCCRQNIPELKIRLLFCLEFSPLYLFHELPQFLWRRPPSLCRRRNDIHRAGGCRCRRRRLTLERFGLDGGVDEADDLRGGRDKVFGFILQKNILITALYTYSMFLF